MSGRPESLVRRLVLLSLAQAAAITAIAVVIALFTMPGHHARPSPPPREGSPKPPQARAVLWGPLWTLALTLAVLLLGGYLTGRWLVAPLRALERATRALGDGNLSVRAELSRADEIGALAKTFDEMAAQIEGLVRSERALLANLSHELRTPLARIRVAVELAQDAEPELAQATLAELEQDLVEVESLLDDILASARLEGAAGSWEVFLRSREPISAAALCEAAVRRFQARHPGREVRLEGEVSARVQGHAMLLRRALENLLENGHKYSPDPRSALTLRARAEGGMACLEVIDQGVGISAEDQRRLCEPFFRGVQAQSARDGLGLGLALVQRVVSAHQGALSVQSAPGEGTRVRLCLPRSEEQ
jgi:two-component system OmpR family sensor kinase